MKKHRIFQFVIIMLVTISMTACGTPVAENTGADHGAEPVLEMLALPELDAVNLDGRKLQVVATTSIIGDVVSQVGGEAIDLFTLMGPGQDPHGFEPTPRDMAAVAQADVIFVNGWDLEQNLVDDLANIAEGIPMVPVSANIAPLEFMGDDGHDHGAADPHTWFSIHNVVQWTKNIAAVLGNLDPANADGYQANAETYTVALDDLAAYAETRFSALPTGQRNLVTNHQSLNYLAHDYGLHILGTVIPAASTMAEPSPRELADLIAVMEENAVCAIFTETTVSDKLAVTVTEELDACDEVQVVKLYTGSIGPDGGGTDSYLGMMRYNIDAIAAGME